MKERIQKILSARGVASRRQAEEMILSGRVICNGMLCKLGDQADVNIDEILVDGSPLPSQEGFVYIMLNKPKGVVTTLSDEKGRKNVSDLVSDCGQRVYPVGRLDMDSEGLLLLTNDGEFANHLMHPKHEVSKVYHVFVKHYSDDNFTALKKPIYLDGYRIHAPKVTLLRNDDSAQAELLITVHEGRNRQVRRMCAAAGMQVKRLIRIAEGDVKLGDLKTGTWRYLSQEEIHSLKR